MGRGALLVEWKLGFVSTLTILTFASVYGRCLARKDAILLTVLFFFAKKSSQKVCVFPDKCVPLHSQIRNEAQNKHRGVEQLVARQAHNLEVTCSSRVSATILKRCKECSLHLFSFIAAGWLVVGVQLGVWLFANLWPDKLINLQTRHFTNTQTHELTNS